MLLEAATLLSATGNAIAGVALPWLVLERTGNPAAAGLVAAATGLPLALSGLVAGTVVDAVGRRRSAIFSDVASCLALLAVPLVDVSIGLSVGWLVVLAAIGAVFDPAGWTARETMLPAVADAAGMRLERVNGVHEAVWGVAFLAGPGAAGLLIAYIGAVSTLWAAAAGFVLSSACLVVLRLPEPPATLAVHPGALWDATVEGIVFVWRARLLRTMGLLSMIIVGIYLPIEAVLLPVHFQAQNAPARLGLLLAAISAGGIAGALAYGAWGYRWGRRATFLGGFLLCGCFLFGLAPLPAFPLMVVAAVLMGVSYGPVDPLINFAMQTRTPERLRGRVYGLITSMTYAAGPLGYLVAGFLVQQYGVRTTFLILSGALVLVALAALPLPSLRTLDDEVDAEAKDPGPAPVRPAGGPTPSG